VVGARRGVRSTSECLVIVSKNALIGILLALGTHVLGAQAASTTRVDVQVRDTSGMPVAGAEVAIVRGLNDARASGVSDERGHVSLVLTSTLSAHDDYQLVARKIGFERSERFFRATRDSLAFDVILRRAAQELAPVVVTAEADLK